MWTLWDKFKYNYKPDLEINNNIKHYDIDLNYSHKQFKKYLKTNQKFTTLLIDIDQDIVDGKDIKYYYLTYTEKLNMDLFKNCLEDKPVALSLTEDIDKTTLIEDFNICNKEKPNHFVYSKSKKSEIWYHVLIRYDDHFKKKQLAAYICLHNLNLIYALTNITETPGLVPMFNGKILSDVKVKEIIGMPHTNNKIWEIAERYISIKY